MDMISDINFWRESVTVAAFGLFLGISVWAYSRKRTDEFEEISGFVIQDDDSSATAERSI